MTASPRQTFGQFGIWTEAFNRQPIEVALDSVRDIERAGFATVWIPEVTGGRDGLTLASLLLGATDALHVANGVLKVSSRAAGTTIAGARLLAEAYPDRYLLGLGLGPRPPAGRTPMQVMVGYLDEISAVSSSPDTINPPMVLAAYGPVMLRLAASRTNGAHTYLVTVNHTREARCTLGPDAFLAVEQAVIFDLDATTARAAARRYLEVYLAAPFNLTKFKRLGYTDDDFLRGGSDQLVDDLVTWGDEAKIKAVLDAHVRAGADHVAIQVLSDDPVTLAKQWGLLADLVAGT